MDIPASELLSHISPEAVHVSIRTSTGDKCAEITIEQLKVLVEAGFVRGIRRPRGKLREIRLTVPPDVAFRELGESRRCVKDQLHTDASVTVMRSHELLPSFHKQHHPLHTRSWNENRQDPLAMLTLAKHAPKARRKVRFRPVKGPSLDALVKAGMVRLSNREVAALAENRRHSLSTLLRVA